MSIRPPTMEQANAERRKLLEQVQNWDDYILALGKISSNGARHLKKHEGPEPLSTNEPVPASVEGSPTNSDSTGSQRMSTAAVAYRVLAAAPKSMRLFDVVKAMREAGWQGSGNDKTDQDRAYAAMYRAKDKFVRPKWGRWTTKK